MGSPFSLLIFVIRVIIIIVHIFMNIDHFYCLLVDDKRDGASVCKLVRLFQGILLNTSLLLVWMLRVYLLEAS